MNPSDAKKMLDALKTVYEICQREQHKKTWYSKRCEGCPARLPGLMCNYNDDLVKAPYQWSAERFSRSDGE